jgi:type I restriction enzyme S subunit
MVKDGYKQTDIGLIPKDWEISQIDEHCIIRTGNKNTQDKQEDAIYPFFVRSQIIEKIDSYSFDGEAVLTAGDGVGTGKVHHYINGKFNFHQRVYCMTDFSNTLDGYFFYLYFKNNFFNRISKMTAKSSVDSVRREMIANMILPIPPKKEQKAIAKALSDTDELITTLEKLISKKEAIKQGTMKQLLTGEKRLSGFCGDWEERNLNDICWFQEGPGLRKWQFTNKGIKVINVTNLVNGYLELDKTNRHISMEEFEKMYKHFEIDEHDIVMASSGNSYSKVSIVRKKDLRLVMNTSVIRFKPLPSMDYNFLHIFLKSTYFKQQIDLLITGGAQPNFGPFHLNKIVVNTPPTIEEQRKIAQILSDMDKEIESLKSKLSKTKAIKDGIMSELLTGKTRLKVKDE